MSSAFKYSESSSKQGPCKFLLNTSPEDSNARALNYVEKHLRECLSICNLFVFSFNQQVSRTCRKKTWFLNRWDVKAPSAAQPKLLQPLINDRKSAMGSPSFSLRFTTEGLRQNHFWRFVSTHTHTSHTLTHSFPGQTWPSQTSGVRTSEQEAESIH